MANSQDSKMTIGEWIERRVTYLLPAELVKKVHSKFGDKFFSNFEYDFELSKFERRVFIDANAFGKRVNGPTIFQELPELDLGPALEEFGIQYVCNSDERSTNKSLKLRRSALAYCGWLVQQEEYHTDVESIKRDFREELLEKGLPNQPDFRFPSLKKGDDSSLLTKEFEKLCGKWRISHFSTIEIPSPLQPSVIPFELSQVSMPEGLIVYAMPDIFPFSGRGEIVEEFEDQRSVAKAPHLEGWFEVVHSAAHGKKRMITLARLFQVQHYWRVLRSRHDAKIKGKKTALKELFAEVFGVSRDTILEDFRKLEKLPVKPLEIPLETFF